METVLASGQSQQRLRLHVEASKHSAEKRSEQGLVTGKLGLGAFGLSLRGGQVPLPPR